MKIDEYGSFEDLSTLSANNSGENVHVESRANAFAIEFLAPGKEVEKIYASETDKGAVIPKIMDTFGISFIAA